MWTWHPAGGRSSWSRTSRPIAEPLAETLTREGFHLEVAGTAADALDAAARVRPDLILLDLMLPDGSGYDVCREVRRSRRCRSSC